jgi:hypothetical protein
MKLFRSTAAALALTTGLLALPVHAQQNASGDPLYTANSPAAFSMVADLLIARPLLIAATVIGAGVFVGPCRSLLPVAVSVTPARPWWSNPAKLPLCAAWVARATVTTSVSDLPDEALDAR